MTFIATNIIVGSSAKRKWMRVDFVSLSPTQMPELSWMMLVSKEGKISFLCQHEFLWNITSGCPDRYVILIHLSNGALTQTSYQVS